MIEYFVSLTWQAKYYFSDHVELVKIIVHFLCIFIDHTKIESWFQFLKFKILRKKNKNDTKMTPISTRWNLDKPARLSDNKITMILSHDTIYFHIFNMLIMIFSLDRNHFKLNHKDQIYDFRVRKELPASLASSWRIFASVPWFCKFCCILVLK